MTEKKSQTNKLRYLRKINTLKATAKATVVNMIIQAADVFIQKIRWRTHFYLNPQERPNKKENHTDHNLMSKLRII